MGMTSVHTNRILRQLRMDGIVEFQRGTVKNLNEGKLQRLAQFDGRYLHLTPSSRDLARGGAVSSTSSVIDIFRSCASSSRTLMTT